MGMDKKFLDVKAQLYVIVDDDATGYFEKLQSSYNVMLRNRKIIFLDDKDNPSHQSTTVSVTLFEYSFVREYLDVTDEKINTKINISGYSKFHLAHLSPYEKLRLSWSFRKTFIQNWKFWKVVIPAVLGFISGWILRMITYPCN